MTVVIFADRKGGQRGRVGGSGKWTASRTASRDSAEKRQRSCFVSQSKEGGWGGARVGVSDEICLIELPDHT